MLTSFSPLPLVAQPLIVVMLWIFRITNAKPWPKDGKLRWFLFEIVSREERSDEWKVVSYCAAVVNGHRFAPPVLRSSRTNRSPPQLLKQSAILLISYLVSLILILPIYILDLMLFDFFVLDVIAIYGTIAVICKVRSNEGGGLE